MRHLLIGALSSAAVLAVVCATPALANGGDANGEANQAQFHPSEPNQTPDWAPGQVPVGEVYRSSPPARTPFTGRTASDRSGSVTAPIRSCPLILDTTNGRETIVCGM